MNINVIDKKALAQVYYIINHMPENDRNKVPEELMQNICENMLQDYIYEDEFSLQTQELLYAILMKYVLDEEQKRKFTEYYKFYDQKQEELKGEYNPNDIFKKTEIEENEEKVQENLQLIKSEKIGIFKKILNFFRKGF